MRELLKTHHPPAAAPPPLSHSASFPYPVPGCKPSSLQTDLLCPGKDDVFLQKVSIVQVFEDDGDARKQLDLVQLHHTLKSSQQVLLGFLVVVAELRRHQQSDKLSEQCFVREAFSGLVKSQVSFYPEEVAFVLLDLIADVLVEEQLAEDEGAHGLHVQTLGLRQDVFVCAIDGPAILLLLQGGGRKQVMSAAT